jgi:uracil-DNA glycosylase family 4
VTNNEYVEWRLANGSACHVCPAKSQRKVGCDGPIAAGIIGIGEAPGEDEEKWGRHRGARYGTPFVGASGYKLRRDNLARAGLVDVVPTSKKPYPELRNLRAFLTNVVMCRPPENKIDSPVGRQMVRCCENSFYAFVERLLSEDPNRTFVAIGATAATALRRRATKIDAHRGRVTHAPDVGAWVARHCKRVPEAEVLKLALRGRKPKEEWWPQFEVFLKGFLRLYKSSARGLQRKIDKREKEQLLSGLPWLVEWTKVWKKQRAAVRKREKETV